MNQVDQPAAERTRDPRPAASARFAWFVGLAAAAGAVGGTFLAWIGVLPPLAGFALLALSLFLGGLLAVIVGGVGLLRTRGGRRSGAALAARGLLIGTVLLIVGLALTIPGRKVPPIHDITTSPERPPSFEFLAKSADGAGSDLTYPQGGNNVAELQRQAYPDLRPIMLTLAPDRAFTEVLAAAHRLGWSVAHEDPARRHFEATVRSRLFRFVDDVAVEIDPGPGGSRVRVRSTSRVGQSDLGANAARIRAFAAELGGFASPWTAEGPRLFVFDCGRIVVSDPAAFSLTREEAGTDELFVPCYLIEHARGMLLWDAGLPVSIAESPEGIEMSGMRLSLQSGLHEQLRELGLAPPDIGYVAFSHLHFDHVGQGNLFKGSTWLVQRVEHEAAFAEPPLPVFQPDLYAELKDSKTTLLEGDHDVFGDGSVKILSTPGHTPGHQSLFVKLAKTGPIVLSGDLYHYPASRRLKRVPVFNTDEAQTRASMGKVEAFLAATGATLWIEHDASLAATLHKSPGYYD